MAEYMIVPTDSIDDTADAIKAKLGSQNDLTWGQDGFASYVEDIPSGGTRPTGTLTFDFTKGISDEETGLVTWSLTGATQDSSGLHISGATHVAKLEGIDLTNCVAEIEVGAMTDSFNHGNHARFVMCDGDSGLIYRSSGYWQVYGYSWSSGSESNSTYFANSTIRIEYKSAGGRVDIYKDNVKMFDNVRFGASQAETVASIRFGSDSQVYFDVTILKCSIYTNEAYALKILMGGAS